MNHLTLFSVHPILYGVFLQDYSSHKASIRPKKQQHTARCLDSTDLCLNSAWQISTSADIVTLQKLAAISVPEINLHASMSNQRSVS